jgi:hypothetical protein
MFMYSSTMNAPLLAYVGLWPTDGVRSGQYAGCSNPVSEVSGQYGWQCVDTHHATMKYVLTIDLGI